GGFRGGFRMRLACRSAMAVLSAASAAAAQGQPPGPPRPTDQLPSGLQMPAEIIPVSPRAHDRPGASAEWMAIWDDLWKRRDDPAALKDLDALTEQHLAEDPNGFEVTRRHASLVAWEADGEPDGSDEKAAKGKIAWRKRVLEEWIGVLRIAVRSHPGNWRAKLYLADALIVNGLEGQDDEAHLLVQQILDAPGGRDPPEEKRVKELARRWKSKH